MKQRRGIRSIIIRAGIFLLLGAIVNVAVAWGCAALVDARSGSRRIYMGQPLPEKFCTMGRFNSFGNTLVTAGCVPLEEAPFDVIIEWEVVSDYKQLLPSWTGDGASWPRWQGTHASGWPTRSLSRVDTDFAFAPERVFGDLVPLPQSPIGQTYLHLPLKPIWPGFAINTLFYAAILWLLLALPGALRRWRRIKRGLCPACAYPVGASDFCSECGKPVTRRPQATATTS